MVTTVIPIRGRSHAAPSTPIAPEDIDLTDALRRAEEDGAYCDWVRANVADPLLQQFILIGRAGCDRYWGFDHSLVFTAEELAAAKLPPGIMAPPLPDPAAGRVAVTMRPGVTDGWSPLWGFAAMDWGGVPGDESKRTLFKWALGSWLLSLLDRYKADRGPRERGLVHTRIGNPANETATAPWSHHNLGGRRDRSSTSGP